MPTTLQVRNLAKKKLTELRRIAAREGVSASEYVKDLIEHHLQIAAEARTKTFAELSKPFQEAFGHLSEAEIDAMVDAARTRHHGRKQSKQRRPPAVR